MCGTVETAHRTSFDTSLPHPSPGPSGPVAGSAGWLLFPYQLAFSLRTSSAAHMPSCRLECIVSGFHSIAIMDFEKIVSFGCELFMSGS